MTVKTTNNIIQDKSYQARVIKGSGQGKKLGFPTINLAINKKLNLIQGVYLCQLQIKKRKHQGLLHYGPRTIFKEVKPTLEVYILDFDKDIKIKTKIEFKLLKFLRRTIRFKDKKELIKQIKQDIKSVV